MIEIICEIKENGKVSRPIYIKVAVWYKFSCNPIVFRSFNISTYMMYEPIYRLSLGEGGLLLWFLFRWLHLLSTEKNISRLNNRAKEQLQNNRPSSWYPDGDQQQNYNHVTLIEPKYLQRFWKPHSFMSREVYNEREREQNWTEKERE